MKTRFDIQKVQPDCYAAMLKLEGYVRKTSLSAAYKELIKVRASQLNGCAYCIEMHTAEARKNGESESRLYALSAWRESPLFSDEERDLLALTDEVTMIHKHGLSDDTYTKLLQHFDENAIAEAIFQVVTINSWNRIAVATRMMHEQPVEA